MADLAAAVETLAKQKLHFEQKCKSMEEMETSLRKALVDLDIQVQALREGMRQLQRLAAKSPRAALAKQILAVISLYVPKPDSSRIADRIDGYDRDDLGESPDY